MFVEIYAYTCTWYRRMNDLSKTKETYLATQDSVWVLHGPFTLLNGTCIYEYRECHVGI